MSGEWLLRMGYQIEESVPDIRVTTFGPCWGGVKCPATASEDGWALARTRSRLVVELHLAAQACEHGTWLGALL